MLSAQHQTLFFVGLDILNFKEQDQKRLKLEFIMTAIIIDKRKSFIKILKFMTIQDVTDLNKSTTYEFDTYYGERLAGMIIHENAKCYFIPQKEKDILS